MTPIDFYASARQYVEHMVPVWLALSPEARGTFYAKPPHDQYALALGVDSVGGRMLPLNEGDRPVLVAASGNLNHAKLRGRANVALMEHGCGLSYGGDTGPFGRAAAESSSYAGGLGRSASLFLHPGEHPAARDRARYPRARIEVVGCPKLDMLPARVPDGRLTVAFSFHWDTSISPETRSTFIFYREHLADLAKSRDLTVIGHGHPRIIERLAPWYKRRGIEVVRDFADVCRRADLYAVDNSSTLYEFASTGRSVLVLNAPYYRLGVEHGLRFWSAAGVGENIWEPYDIHEAVRRNLAEPDLWRVQREDAVNQVYAFRTGAAERAARVLEDWAGGL